MIWPWIPCQENGQKSSWHDAEASASQMKKSTRLKRFAAQSKVWFCNGSTRSMMSPTTCLKSMSQTTMMIIPRWLLWHNLELQINTLEPSSRFSKRRSSSHCLGPPRSMGWKEFSSASSPTMLTLVYPSAPAAHAFTHSCTVQH